MSTTTDSCLPVPVPLTPHSHVGRPSGLGASAHPWVLAHQSLRRCPCNCSPTESYHSHSTTTEICWVPGPSWRLLLTPLLQFYGHLLHWLLHLQVTSCPSYLQPFWASLGMVLTHATILKGVHKIAQNSCMAESTSPLTPLFGVDFCCPFKI